MAHLDEIRETIETLDEQLVDVIQKRVQAAREAGRLKREKGQALRDYEVEDAVVDRMETAFREEGLNPEIGARIARTLIGEALRVQEADTLTLPSADKGRALIIGGAGRMGQWCAQFLASIGYDVTIQDPAGPIEPYPYVDTIQPAAQDADLVLVATPPNAMRDVLAKLEGLDALILDIASLKTPIEDTLRQMAKTQPVTSVHPLWGPNARVLSDKNVLVLDCGNEEANQQAVELFEQTAATIVQLPLDAHDPLMALTLNLPHALNLVYADVLQQKAPVFDKLTTLGGPTFLKQTDVAAEVARENPELYRQIQALNRATPSILTALHDALDRLAERLNDPDAFETMMLEHRDYFGDYEGWIHP